MRALLLPVLALLLTSLNTTAQEKGPFFTGENDRNYLKNYKAPDFKFRGLTSTFTSEGRGSTTDTENTQTVTANGGLTYFQVINNQRYQGGLSALSQNDFNLRNDNAAVSQNFLSRNSSNMHNRFYFGEGWFWGLHDQSNLRIWAFPSNSTNDLTELSVRPAFSIGHGRIEPVAYGRLAMDVERLLGKGNRLNPGFSEENRTALANRIAQIQNRRYYDVRLGRIYQLESLDSVLRNMNVVNDMDIVYFSLLQDAFLYSNYASRSSGIRHEIGVSQGVTFNSNGPEELMSYGFYSFSYFLPQSYAVQHNFTASLLGGFRESETPGTSNFPGWLDARYSLGLYPTSRTYLSFAAVGGTYLTDVAPGYTAGADVDGYYYISPRFRFELNAAVRYGKNYDAHGFNHVAVLNFDRLTEQISYSFNIGLVYAIF